MYVDSCENLLEILVVVIVLSPTSSVCGLNWEKIDSMYVYLSWELTVSIEILSIEIENFDPMYVYFTWEHWLFVRIDI